MIIKAYLKPSCGWSNGVRAVLRKYALDFDDIDIIGDRASYAEMVRKSGQPLSPCVEVDGVMLADVSGEELENYLLSNDMVKPSDAAVGTATNAGCSDEEHAKMATKTIRLSLIHICRSCGACSGRTWQAFRPVSGRQMRP